MARKKKHEEHENLERWLVSYADFITLLFAFFTTMYAISNVDAKKMGRLVMAMQAAFDPTPFMANGSSSMSPIDRGGSSSSGEQQDALKAMVAARVPLSLLPGKLRGPGDGVGKTLSKIKADLVRLILDDHLADKVRIVVKNKTVILSLAEAGFFGSGAAEVRPESEALLGKIAMYLKDLPNLVRIEGHTDNLAVRGGRFRSNWDLSTARATSVIADLVGTYGIDPLRLSAAGYAEHRPIASNDTPEGRNRNRRVDIVITSLLEPGDAGEGF